MCDAGHNNRKLIIAILLAIVFIGYIVGVPVPTKKPYIGLTIETDKQSYSLGETIHIESSVINKTPLKIKLEPFYPMSYEIYRMEYNDTRITSNAQNPDGPVTEINPYGKYILQDMRLNNVSKPGDYLISFKVCGLQTSKIIRVN